jgi:hypothetical protein
MVPPMRNDIRTDKGTLMRRVVQTAAAALLLAAAFSPAQALVIGAADSSNAIPFGQTIGGFVYQQVYNATNFSSSLNIGQITFYNSLTPGGAPMGGNFDIYLSTTGAQVGALPTDVPAGFPASLTKVFSGGLPAIAAGRLDFDLASSFLYDPSLGNLLMTVVSFDFVQQPNPLFLDADENAGSIFSRRFSAGGGNSNIGLVTGFNDEAVSPTPIPAVGAGVPLVLAGSALLRRWRRRKTAAKIAA